jgi:hypothetical protein
MPGAPPLDRCVRVTVGTPEERSACEVLRAVWPQVAEALRRLNDSPAAAFARVGLRRVCARFERRPPRNDAAPWAECRQA